VDARAITNWMIGIFLHVGWGSKNNPKDRYFHFR